jgi:hypothetical protein
VIDRAGVHVAAELKKAVKFDPLPPEPSFPLRADSISQNRNSVTFSGDLSKLKVDDILEVPVIPGNREPRVGEETHVYVKIKQVGTQFAIGLVWDIANDKNIQVNNDCGIDQRRPVRW